jgi:hypothetical protein
MNDTKGKVKKISGSESDAMKRKSWSCFSKYNGFKVVREISRLLEVEVLNSVAFSPLADSKDL